MRDILQSRYLRSNGAHKQLARTSLNDGPLPQENHFLGQYHVPAKLNAFNSRVQDKLNETTKPVFQRRETLTKKF